ncbi:DUF4974 domain-containing protein [Chitinophaga sp. Mgbs1]|uniref:DUF4974 domain-containing protein n=1 Tax=Chitinophaga solisilvae TaxID=1233460 RepID=A0A3S1JKC2_9BACT|nr:DUF4974 domain-containing protein [Chitinophaga solisilvae]
MQQNERIITLIEKYSADACTDSELQELEAWYAAYENNAPLSSLLDASARQELKGELLHSIRQEIARHTAAKPVTGRSRRLLLLSRAAAAVIITATVSWGVHQRMHPDVVTTGNGYTQISTARGETRQVVLPDSSKVWLNADSRIRYAAGFNASRREVFLDGEAFFDIHRDPARSFVVHTGKVTTQVLGTAFNVSSYPGSETLAVTVVQGKVRVAEGAAEMGVLLPDQQISYNRSTRKAIYQRTDAAATASWKEGWLVFREQSFREIAAALQRKFDISIDISDPALARCRFTASFAPGTDLPKVLNLLCRINHSNYQLKADSNKIIIKGKGCL